MTDEFPIVTYQFEQVGHAAIGIGYLVMTPDGLAWCFPSRETLAKYPGSADAFEVDPANLRNRPIRALAEKFISTLAVCPFLIF